MNRRYVTVDVFTDRLFGGNPLAVVLDAAGLSTEQMQAVATEFNYSETTFVLAPRDTANTAHVRIFTPRVEVPFAGHPNVGTAVVLARALEANGSAPVEQFLFEEGAGVVAIRLLRDRGTVVGAEFTAPAALSLGPAVSVADAAACLSLGAGDISVSLHPPQIVSVGLPWLVTEVTTRETLRQARPDLAVHERVLPAVGTDGVFAYWRKPGSTALSARAFAPLDATVEDPATGSATAATLALLASLSSEPNTDQAWRVEQGVDMGRPSLLLGRTERRGGVIRAVHVAGRAMTVMHGLLPLDAALPAPPPR